MDCPHCQSKKSQKRRQTTVLGYPKYYCRDCGKEFNERTGTAFNFIEYPNEVVMLVVYLYYRFKLSLDDVVELMAIRNVHLSHQTVHNWCQTFGTGLSMKLRVRRKGKAGKKWHVDATYLKIEGRWCYLYRAIDKEGNLVNVYLSDVRDQAAAEAFLKQSKNTAGLTPDQITTDKEPALYPAIKNVFGNSTKHRDSKYMNNRLEQNHRGIKSWYKPMKGFKNIFCALISCTVFEEIRQHFNMRNKTRSECRHLFAPRFQNFNKLLTETA